MYEKVERRCKSKTAFIWINRILIEPAKAKNSVSVLQSIVIEDLGLTLVIIIQSISCALVIAIVAVEVIYILSKGRSRDCVHDLDVRSLLELILLDVVVLVILSDEKLCSRSPLTLKSIEERAVHLWHHVKKLGLAVSDSRTRLTCLLWRI